MSKEQVELDYQKLLWERQARILADQPKNVFGWLIYRMTAHYYPMPLMPLDEDFRQQSS